MSVLWALTDPKHNNANAVQLLLYCLVMSQLADLLLCAWTQVAHALSCQGLHASTAIDTAQTVSIVMNGRQVHQPACATVLQALWPARLTGLQQQLLRYAP
jgi:hypothetical protein